MIPGLGAEALNWSLRLSTAVEPPPPLGPTPAEHAPAAPRSRSMVDPARGLPVTAAEHDRSALTPGAVVPGPAVIVEDETSTIVLAGFTARINGAHHIVITRDAAT